MFLTASNLVHYLLASGRISHESVVDGDFIAVEAGRRNRNFKVIRRQGRGFFIKQIQSPDPQAVATLRREAACYQLVESNPSLTALGRLMPTLVGYDAKRSILLVELLPGDESLSAYHHRLGRFPEEIGAALGRALGACHSEAGHILLKQAAPAVFPRQVPWILSIHSTNPAFFTGLSAANQKLLEIVTQNPDFPTQLDQLRSGWCFDSLIHGDIKWENCIMCHAANGDPELRIVDWELADYGDACWDVGGLLQAYLVHWVLAMPLHAGGEPTHWVREAPFKFEAMQPSIRAFWREYIAARGVAPQASRPLLTRCVQYCGARLIQTAYEYLASSPQMNSCGITLLQISANILKNPQAAIGELLAL